MTTEPLSVQFSKTTSTQLGAIGEALIAVHLVLGSGGRLAPFVPFADDDGIDLLIYDKVTKRSLPVQVKSRAKVDDERAQTVQFDTQTTTFSEEGNSHLIAALLDGNDVRRAWLLPMTELSQLARNPPGKLVMVASAKATSNDKFAPYRHDDTKALAEGLIRTFESWNPLL